MREVKARVLAGERDRADRETGSRKKSDPNCRPAIAQ